MAGVVGVVTRKSSRDEQKVSVNRQRALGEEWAAAAFPDREVRVYEDNAVSGVVMDRPGWQAFCTDVRLGDIDVLWCYEQSRLTRGGTLAWEEVVAMLTAAGIAELHTHRQGVISVAEGQRFGGRIYAILDQEERERVRLRTRDSLARLAAEGRPPGGDAYGYLRSIGPDGRKAMTPHPEQAPIVAEVVARVAAGEPFAHIARDLNARGVPAARGGTWTVVQIRSLARRVIPAGFRVHNGDLIPGTWAPIVDVRTWERAQAVLADNRVVVDRAGHARTVPRYRQPSRRWLLTGGLARCGVCDSPLRASQRGTRRDRASARPLPPIYLCHISTGPTACNSVAIHAEPFEGLVVAEVLRAVDEGRQVRTGTGDERETVAGERDAARARLRRLTADFASGVLDEDAYVAGRETAVSLLRFLDRRLDVLGAPSVTLDGLRARWPGLSLGEKRQAVEVLVGSVVVNRATPGLRRFDPDRVDIRWID